MGRRTTGVLQKRGKKGGYHVVCNIHGKRFNYALYDDEGRPITSRKEARARADMLLLPLRLRNDIDRLKAIQCAIEGTEAAAARAEAAMAEARARGEERKRRERTQMGKCWGIYWKAQKSAKAEAGAADRPKVGTNRYNYHSYFKAFAAWAGRRFFGREMVLLADVTEDDAREFFGELRTQKSAGTYNKYLHFLRRFTDVVFMACGLEMLKNPFDGVETVGGRSIARRVLTDGQVAKLMAAASGELKTLCMVGYYTGLRLGDCCTLRWTEVDLQRRVVTRVPSKTAKSTGKTVKIGIPVALGAHLAQLREAAGAQVYVMPEMARRYGLNRNNVCRPIKALFEACGMVNPAGRVEYGFHSLRHTYITRQIEAGVPLAVVQSIVGHSNPVMTEYYIGEMSDSKAVEFADKAFAGTLDKNKESEKDTFICIKDDKNT